MVLESYCSIGRGILKDTFRTSYSLKDMFSKNIEKVIQKKEENEAFSDVFKNNPQLLFLHKKTERLTAALYMVTNLLPEKEPLRWSLRRQGVGLVSAVLSFISAPRNQRESEERQARTFLLKILALLEVSRHAGIFSDMNISVLKQECEALAVLFDESAYKNQDDRARTEEATLFPKDFFHIAASDTGVTSGENALRERNGAKKEPVVLGYQYGSRDFSGAPEEIVKDISKKIKDNIYTHTNTTSDKNRDRRNSVLALLKKKSPISVKDVVRVVSGCGEKTIQRELSAMVDEGILKKSGKRRWTTYSLG